MGEIDFKEEIRSAKAEMEKWSEQKKASIRLEGTDKYFDQQQRLSTSTQNSEPQLEQNKK